MAIGLIIGAIIGIAIGTVIYGILLWIVGKLGLGLKVDSFLSALLAGLLVAIVGAFAVWISSALNLQVPEGLAGAIIQLVFTAGVLRAVGNSLQGVEVDGWKGAFLAAVAIAVIGWLINFALAGVSGSGSTIG
jgi:uncharacterized membrane protein YvlD (DUF360 family)